MILFDQIVSVEPVMNDANGNENWDVLYKNLETQEVHKVEIKYIQQIFLI